MTKDEKEVEKGFKFDLEPNLECILILDEEGKRVVAQYYKSKLNKLQKQLDFESRLFLKTSNLTRLEAEAHDFENRIVVSKVIGNCYLYCISGNDENELIVLNLLNSFEDAISTLLKHQVYVKTLKDNIDMVLLVIDEMIDSGFIFENDPDEIVERVSMKTEEKEPSLSGALKGFGRQLFDWNFQN